MSESGMRWERHLGRACAVGTALALLVFVPFTGVHRAQAAGLEGRSGDQTYAATSETGDAIPQDMLPDSIDDSIPENATVVAKNVAVTDQGDVKDISTGEPVTDKTVVGTPDRPADPLAKTGGRSFIPVPVKEVKEQLDQSARTRSAKPAAAHEQTGGDQSAAVHDGVYHPQGRSGAVAKPMALGNNGYGAHWGTYQGTQAFFEGNGTLFAQQAKGVVDVSQWQGRIDWTAARNSGVEGAIIRIGYGWGNGYDNTALYNIKECKRLGIPFGIYLYSYAYDGNTGWAEGDGTVDLLRRAGVSPGDLAYPVYYDLENWVWAGHAPPTSPAVYDGIVNAWYNRLQSAGYNKLSVYSYTFYLNSALNSGNIRSKTHWVASYGSRTGFDFPANQRCWQYADDGIIPGITGKVDFNACGNLNQSDLLDVRQLPKVNIPNGEYYINSWMKDSSGFDIAGGSTNREVPLQLFTYNTSEAQRYNFVSQRDGSYVIRNVNSNKVLDVSSGQACQEATVWQYDYNGSAAQRWFIRDAGDAYYLQSALGNWVLNITNSSLVDGTRINLHSPTGNGLQRFQLASTKDIDASLRYRIESEIRSGLVLDIPGGSVNNGIRVQTYNWNGSDAQLFYFQSVGNGLYEIINVNSGKRLEVAEGRTEAGTSVQQYRANGTQAQRWLIRDADQGRFTFVNSISNKALDIPSADTGSGKPIQVYDQNGTHAQQWKLREELTYRQKIDYLAAQHANDLADGGYIIRTGLNGAYCLDVPGGSTDNGVKIQLYVSNGTSAQQWVVAGDKQGYKTIKNVRSDKVLDVEGGDRSKAARIQQYRSNGTYAQKWIPIKSSSGSFKLVSALDMNLVLDLSSGQVSNGNQIQLYTGNGTEAQSWNFR